MQFVEEMEAKGGRDAKRAREMLADLTLYAPNSPSSEWVNSDFSKDLGQGIYEFRWNGRGGAPRILWFYDERKVVVCVHGVVKQDWQIEPQDMEVAVRRRDEYLAAKVAGVLTIIDADELED